MPLIKALMAIVLLAAVSKLPPYESELELQASEILSPQLLHSEDHDIRESVANDGFFNHYVVETPFGDFDAEGNRTLTSRVQEAHALAELDRVSNTDLFIDAAQRAVMAPVQAVGRFVDEPVDTVKGIPGGISRKFRSIGRAVKSGSQEVKKAYDESKSEDEAGSKAENESEGESESEDEGDSKSKTYALKWFGVTGSERRWAQKLGVDPYSSNTVLREKMSAVAKVDAAASFGAKLAMPSLGAVGYVVTVSNLVWSLDGEELRAYNLKQLVAAGISEELINGFLDNPLFSPTQQTVMGQAMVEMKDIEGLDKVLSLPGWVETETEAWFYAETILLMSRFVKSVRSVRAIVGEGLVPALITVNDELIYIVPVDFLTWNEAIASLLQGPMVAGISGVTGGRELWLNGNATETASAGFSSLGWSIKTKISLD